jgi:hypothetical protein
MAFATRRVSLRLALSHLMIVFLTATLGGPTVSAAANTAGTTIDLLNGSFTLTTADGEISGSYQGQASVSSSGRVTTSLDMNVTGGTQLFQGATGTITGDGTGAAFVGEGSFSIYLRGSVSTPGDSSGFRLRGKISGTSSLSCLNTIASVTLDGDGSFGKLGDGHATLTHVVASLGCSP